MNHTTDSSPHTPHVEIYTAPFCGFCMRAKSLLDSKGVPYQEYGVMMKPGLHDQMIKRAGGRTSVPQIFIDNEHIGGSDELAALERAGILDSRLGLI